MDKKKGFNLMLFVFIANLFVIFSCRNDLKNPDPEVLMRADRDFSSMSVREGMFKAFLQYIEEEGVILRDNSLPLKGREVLLQAYSGRSDTTFVLSWEPLFGKISDSGDLGYTYGIWTNTEKSTNQITKGTYLTIWHKQVDGSWKFVLDTGNQGLPESQNQ